MTLMVSPSRLRRIIRHFKEGTVEDRLAWEVQKWKSALRKSPAQRFNEHRSRKWNLAKNKSGYVNLKVEGGARLRLYTDSALGRMIYCDGFELDERALLWRYLQPGDVFVDVGANIGLFTVIAARRVGKKGRIYSFEPAGLIRRRLEENITLNRLSNVNIQPFALSDHAGSLEISIPTDGHDAWSSLAMPIAGTEMQRERIEAITWDAFARQVGLGKVMMLKIDVEGWENHVLSGACTSLESADAPLLQVEFTDAAAQAAGSSCAALYQHLLDFGYTVCRYDIEQNRLVPDLLRTTYPYDNLYATKHIDADNRRLKKSYFFSRYTMSWSRYEARLHRNKWRT